MNWMRNYSKSPIYIFLFIFLLRIFAVILSLTTSLNPYAQADVISFVESAEYIASGLQHGGYVSVERSSDYQRWGTLLAPFWLLPGPSLVYASVVNAAIGSLAIYNVYVIGANYYSQKAGIIGILPMALFPSFLLIHGTLLREAVILFGITATARVLLVSSDQRSKIKWLVAAISLIVALILRTSNVPVVIIAIGAALFVYCYRTDRISSLQITLGMILSPIVYLLARPWIQNGILWLANIRQTRANWGRTTYMVGIYPTTLPEVIAFSWIGAAYFLFAPFPWMIENVQDLIVGVEALMVLLFAVASPWGIRAFFNKNPVATIGLLIGFLAAAVLYGLGTGNFGTAVRQRQMFVWVLFLFGGVAIADHFQFRIRYANQATDNTE